MKTEILKGEAALQRLKDIDSMPDWRARQELEIARTYGLNNTPIKGGRQGMSIRYQNGYYYLGDPDYSQDKGARR